MNCTSMQAGSISITESVYTASVTRWQTRIWTLLFKACRGHWDLCTQEVTKTFALFFLIRLWLHLIIPILTLWSVWVQTLWLCGWCEAFKFCQWKQTCDLCCCFSRCAFIADMGKYSIKTINNLSSWLTAIYYITYSI